MLQHQDHPDIFDSGNYTNVISKDIEEDTGTHTKKGHVARLLELMLSSQEGYDKALEVIKQNNEIHRYGWIGKELRKTICLLDATADDSGIAEGNGLNGGRRLSGEYKSSTCRGTDAVMNSKLSQPHATPPNTNYLLCLLKLLKCLLNNPHGSRRDKDISYELADSKILEALDLISSPSFNASHGLLELVSELREHLHAFKHPSTLESHDVVTVFYKILNQVKDTPQLASFQAFLHNLLHTSHNNHPLQASIWQATAEFSSKAKSVESQSELQNLLRNEGRMLEGGRLMKMNECDVVACGCACHFRQASCEQNLLPPPPPPPLPPPAPPLPKLALTHSLSVSESLLNLKDTSDFSNIRKLPQTPKNSNSTSPHSTAPQPPPVPLDTLSKSHHFDLALPIPTRKMKKLQWSKIPAGLVVGNTNVWMTTLSKMKHNKQYKVNFSELEMMFSKTEDFGSKTNIAETEGRKKRAEEVSLLENKRSLNINIFLHQIKSPHKQLIQSLVQGGQMSLNIEQLKGLVRILPEPEELEMVKSYKGDISKCGNAEKFYYELISYPTFNKSVQTHLMREEFQQLAETIVPTLEAYVISIKDILRNKLLPSLLELVLLTGNFLNTGAHAGEALAFKLPSLLRLGDLKSNVQGVTLMHYLAETATKNNAQMRELPLQLKWIKEASQYSLESVTNDMKVLSSKLVTMEHNLSALASSLAHEFEEFLKTARESMGDLERGKEKLKEAKEELARYFCEDENSFKLDECLSIINTFVEAFDKAVKNNDMKAEKMKLIKQTEGRLRRQSSLGGSKARQFHRKSVIFSKQLEDDEFSGKQKANKRNSLSHVLSTSLSSMSSMTSLHESTATTSGSSGTDNPGDETSERLFDLLNSSCITNGFNLEGGFRLRRKVKPSLSNEASMHERERSNPEKDFSEGSQEFAFNDRGSPLQPFDRNHVHRRSMFESRNINEKRRSFSGEKNVKFADELIQKTSKTTPMFRTPCEVEEREDSGLMGQREGFSGAGEGGGSLLTERTMMLHDKGEWRSGSSEGRRSSLMKSNRSDNHNFLSNNFKDKVAECCEGEQLDRNNKVKFQIPPNQLELTHGALDYNNSSNIGYRYHDSTNSLLVKEGRFENDSVCSGTDEGFESMRNSVVSDDNNRTSPLNDSLNNTLTNNNISNTCNSNTNLKKYHEKQPASSNNDHHVITCSLDSLVRESHLSLPLNPIDIRGATSVVSVDQPKPLQNPDGDKQFLSYSDLNTPNKSSTSTLKSSGSGLHLENVNSNLDIKNSKLEEVFGEVQLDGGLMGVSSNGQSQQLRYKSLSQPPLNKKPLKDTDQKSKHKHRTGGGNENSLGGDFKKCKAQIDVQELSARLSQPKKQSLSSASSTPKQPTQVSHITPSKPQRTEKSRAPSSDSFKRGGLLRTTLPVKEPEMRRDTSQPSRRISDYQSGNKDYISHHNHNSTLPNDLPPKPPTRTTSMAAKHANDHSNSQKRRSAYMEYSSKNHTAFPNGPDCNLSTCNESTRDTGKFTPPNKETKSFSANVSSNFLFKKILPAKKHPSPSANPPELKDVPKISRPTKPRSQTLTTYKR